MKNEQRPVVIQTFHYACLQKLSFDEAVASVIEMCNNIPIEGLKMAAAITSTERYCFKFQLDKCTYKKCRFIHQLMNEQQKKESGFDKNRPDMKNYDMKSNNKDKKFKGKKCSLILYIHAPVRTSYVHERMCITLQDPGT